MHESHALDPISLDPDLVVLHEDNFIASTALIMGDVHVAEGASVWFHVVVRGDMSPVRIGERVNVQDGTVIHGDTGFPTTLEEGATVGHRCVIHGCTVKRGAMIGMGAIVMNGAVIGEESLVGAGALVTEGRIFPPRSLILGNPARRVGPLSERHLAIVQRATDHYVRAGRAFRAAGWDRRDR